MIDPIASRIWAYRFLFVLLSAGLLYLHLLPLRVAVPGWAAPDLILCLAVVWVFRQPDYVPTLSLALVFLIADFLLQRPPGLFAALTLVGTHYLRSRRAILRDIGFLQEWLIASIVLAAILLGYRVALIVTLVQSPPLVLALQQLAVTVAAYPLVIAFSEFVLGVRPTSAHDIGRGRLRP